MGSTFYHVFGDSKILIFRGLLGVLSFAFALPRPAGTPSKGGYAPGLAMRKTKPRQAAPNSILFRNTGRAAYPPSEGVAFRPGEGKGAAPKLSPRQQNLILREFLGDFHFHRLSL